MNGAAGRKDKGGREMGALSLNRLGGLLLFLGPLLALIFFLIQPGGVLIESADPTDAVATITALASNAFLSNLTALVIALGLLATTFGLYVLQSNLRGGGGDALTRIGLATIGLGNIGWIMAQGLNLVLADAGDPQAMQVAVAVFAVRSGITLLSGVAIALGFLVFSYGLAGRDDFNKIAALIASLASIVALVAFILALSDSGMADTSFLIARVCYVVWAAWTVYLGWGLLKRPA